MPNDMSHRVHNNQILPVVNQTMPVFLTQPAMPPCGQVMTHAPNPSVPGSIVPCHNQPSYITAPVTLSSSMQPTLTYAITTPEVKEPQKLSTVEENVEDNEETHEKSKSNLPNGHCTENDVDKKQPRQTHYAVEIKSPPKSDTDTTKTSISNHVDDPGISPKAASLSVTTSLAKLQISKSPVKTDPQASATKSAPADKVSTEPAPCEVNGKVAEKPVINGYATAARKVVPKPLLVNGNV